MAASDLTVTGTLTDALGTAYDFARTKMWVTFNTENGRVTDDEGVIRLDAGTATVNSDGTFTMSGIPCPGASNPSSFQVKIHFDAPPRLPGPRDVKRFVGDFGWMTITEDADLADLEDEQAIPAEYQTAFTEAAQAYLDAQAEIAGLTGEDDAVALLIDDDDSDTAAAVAARIDVGRAVSARAYGAFGSGVIDEGPALQDALDDLAQTAGTAFARTLHLEIGKTYLTNQALTINAPVSIWGLNQLSTVIKAGPSFPEGQYVLSYIKDGSSPVILEGRVPGLSLTGFTLDGSSRARQINALNLELFDRANIDIRIDSFRGTAFRAISFRESHVRIRSWLCGDPNNPALDLNQTLDDTAEGANLNMFHGSIFALNMGDIRIRSSAGVVTRANYFTNCVIHFLNEWIENYADVFGYYALDQEGDISGRIVIDNARSVQFDACRFHLNGRGQPLFWLADTTAGTSTANSVTISNSLMSYRGGAYSPRTIATVDTATDSFTYISVTDPSDPLNTGSNRGLISSGSRVRFSVSTGGALPAPLVAGTDYYAIRASGTATKVATSRANALAGTAIDLTTTGSGTISLTQYDTAVTVDTATDTLTALNHRYTTGALVQVGGAVVPTGLTATATPAVPAGDYYVIRVDKDTLQLADTMANALAGTAVNITTSGTDVYVVPQDFLGWVDAGTLLMGSGNIVDGPAPTRGYFKVRDNGAITPYGAVKICPGQIWSAGATAPIAEYTSGAQQIYRFEGAAQITRNNHPLYMTNSAGTGVQVANYSAGNVMSFGTLTGTDNARLYAGGIATVVAGGSERFRAQSTGLSFHGVAAFARPTAYTQTYSTASRTQAALTSADAAGATPTKAEFDALRADVINVKQVLNSVIDDGQGYGLFQ